MIERQTDRHLVLNKTDIRNNMIERQTDRQTFCIK